MALKSYQSRVTAKGQTTIPLEVRQHLQVGPGDVIQFVLVDGHFEIIPRNRSATNLFGRLKEYAIDDTAVDDYRDAVAEHFAKAGEKRGDEDEAA